MTAAGSPGSRSIGATTIPSSALTYVAEALSTDGTVSSPRSRRRRRRPRSGRAACRGWARRSPLAGAVRARARRRARAREPRVPRRAGRAASATCREARSSCSPGAPRLGWARRSCAPTASCSSSGRTALALNDREAHALLDGGGSGGDRDEARAAERARRGLGRGAVPRRAVARSAATSSLASFGGDDRFVTDYLRAEELGRVKPAELEFLLRTGRARPHVRRRSATRCSSATTRRQLLEQLERDNLFVVAARPPAHVVPLPPPVPGDAPGRAQRGASPSSWPRSIAGRPRGARRTASPRSRSSTRPRPATLDGVARLVTRVRLSVLPQRPGHDGRALARAVRRPGNCSSGYPGDRGVRRLGARTARPARRGRALGARRRRAGPQGRMPDGSPFDGLGSHRPRAALQRKASSRCEPTPSSRCPASPPASPWRPARSSCTPWRRSSRATSTEAELGLGARCGGGSRRRSGLGRRRGALRAGAPGAGARRARRRGVGARAGAPFIDEASSPEYVVTAIVLRRHREDRARQGTGRARPSDARRARSAPARCSPTRCPGSPCRRGSSSRRRIWRSRTHRGATAALREAGDVLRRRPGLGTLVARGGGRAVRSSARLPTSRRAGRRR